jgi:hypothetical protein
MPRVIPVCVAGRAADATLPQIIPEKAKKGRNWRETFEGLGLREKAGKKT